MKKVILKTALMLLLMLALMSGVYAEETNSSYAPKITVYLSNAQTGSENANTTSVTTVLARVVYEGCVDGQEYVFAIGLIEQSSGVVCMLTDGRSMYKTTFTAEGRAGVFEFQFVTDASRFAGSTLEEIHYIEGYEWAYTGDTSAKHGLIYVPAVEINAVSESGEKTVLAGDRTAVCDVLSYSGFVPGEEYKLVTGLMETATGSIICGSDGIPVSATSKFTPKETSGQIATKITASLKDYGDKDVTLFEDIYIISKTGESVLLASSRNEAQENAVVAVRYAEVCVVDEMYGTPLKGVVVKFQSDAESFPIVLASDENGKCYVPLNSDEVYTCTVLSEPRGYLQYTEVREFTYPENGELELFKICMRQKNTIVFTRTDAETGEGLAGIVTEIRNADGKRLGRIISDENGKCRFDADAYWKETAASAEENGADSFALSFSFTDTTTPTEYYPRESSWTVSIDEESNITGLTELQSYKRYPVTVRVETMDGTGLPDAELSIIGQDGKVQGRAVTDHEGNIYFTPQRTGKYVVVEDEVPLGYVHPLRNKRFTIEENGQVSGKLTITNFTQGFATGAVIAVIVTFLFLDAWIAVRFIIKKTIKEKVMPMVDIEGKHSK